MDEYNSPELYDAPWTTFRNLFEYNVVGDIPVADPTAGSYYAAWHPDSHTHHGAHPEFAGLYQRFIKYNRTNNMADVGRLWAFILNIKQVLAEGIPGDMAELGVWRGNSAAVLAQLAAGTGRQVYLYDTYTGFDPRDMVGIDEPQGMAYTATDTTLSVVCEVVGEGPHVHYIQGYWPDTITDEARARTYAVVSIDCDLYAPVKAALEFFYPRLAQGGILMLHDYSSLHWPGARQAIDEWVARTGEYLVLMPDKSGSAFVRKAKKRDE